MKNITRFINIVCVLLLSLVANAASLTATIVAYDSVSLSGDVERGVNAHFSATAKSGGKVTTDHSATLLLTGLPASTIQCITLYMHSNKSGGAATVMLSLGDRTWLVASGRYDKWPDIAEYGTTSLPIVALQQALQVKKNTSLTLQIEGTANSVYLDRVVLTYTLAPKVPHTVTLQWLSANGQRTTQTLQETQAQEGVLLPSVATADSVLCIDSLTWYWIGWCKQEWNAQTSSPIYYETNDIYQPDEDCTLYALYTTAPERTLLPDSSMQSGEYAIARMGGSTDQKWMYLLQGAWQSGRINMPSIDLLPNALGEYTWRVTSLENTYRYQFTFTKDSVTVYHPQSKKWIGHATTTGSNTYTRWTWQRTKDGTLRLMGATDQKELTIKYDAFERCFYAAYASETEVDEPYWYLFPTASVPSDSERWFTTFPATTSLPEPSSPAASCHKWLDSQGRIMIKNQQYIFTILGQPL